MYAIWEPLPAFAENLHHDGVFDGGGDRQGDRGPSCLYRILPHVYGVTGLSFALSVKDTLC